MRVLLFCLALLLAAPAWAEPANEGPIYNPASKSYFALVDASEYESRYHVGVTWIEALHDARQHVFRSVAGRLAPVENIDVHEFIIRHFQIREPAWIGIRYWCYAHRLDDSAGHDISRSHFAAWAKAWKQDEAACQPNPHYKEGFLPGAFMPVAYAPTKQGLRWIGKGPAKVYNYYFIEYQTGGP